MWLIVLLLVLYVPVLPDWCWMGKLCCWVLLGGLALNELGGAVASIM